MGELISLHERSKLRDEDSLRLAVMARHMKKSGRLYHQVVMELHYRRTVGEPVPNPYGAQNSEPPRAPA